MKKAILLIDGENFLHKVKEVLINENLRSETAHISNIQLSHLINKIFQLFSDIQIIEIRYYAAKLKVYEPQRKKSEELILMQRRLKHNLEKQGIKFIVAGNVRAQENIIGKKKSVTFKEKGVDVRIAVDMVTLACDKQVDTIILCSSDSDLQPAVKESKSRGINIIYLGFSHNPNKGLSITSNQSILFRNPEIVASIK